MKTNSIANPIGLRIKQVRKARNFTQDVVAERLGITRSAISAIEKGKNGPRPTTLKAIAEILDISLDTLTNGDLDAALGSSPEQNKDSRYPAGHDNVHAYKLLDDIPVIHLPHVSFRARASIGYAQLQRFKDTDIFDKILFRLPPGRVEEDYKGAVVFDIEGDSMEPSLRDGQQVIAWPVAESKWEYLHNTTCVVDYDEHVTVKAIFQNDLNNRDGLMLHATGGRGGSFMVERKDIHSIWEVREFYGVVPYRLM